MLSRTIGEIVCSCEAAEARTAYQQMESLYGSGNNRRLIDGKITGCGKCVGYCRFEKHPGFLTRMQRKEHNCLGKRCFYYIARHGGKKERAIVYPSAVVVM